MKRHVVYLSIVVWITMQHHLASPVILRPQWFPYFRNPNVNWGSNSGSAVNKLSYSTRGNQWFPFFHSGKRGSRVQEPQAFPALLSTMTKMLDPGLCPMCGVTFPPQMRAMLLRKQPASGD